MRITLCAVAAGLSSCAAWSAAPLAPVGRPALHVRQQRARFAAMQTEPNAAETNAEATDGSGGVRQLLGLKGATEATGEEFLNWKIRLQLTKPATWVPFARFPSRRPPGDLVFEEQLNAVEQVSR